MKLHIFLVISLIALELSTCPVHCASTPEDANDESDDNFLREVFRINLMEDIYTENGKDVKLSPELQDEIEDRIDAFESVSTGTDRVRKGRGLAVNSDEQIQTHRRKKRSARDNSFEGEWMTISNTKFNNFISNKNV